MRDLVTLDLKVKQHQRGDEKTKQQRRELEAIGLIAVAEGKRQSRRELNTRIASVKSQEKDY